MSEQKDDCSDDTHHLKVNRTHCTQVIGEPGSHSFPTILETLISVPFPTHDTKQYSRGSLHRSLGTKLTQLFQSEIHVSYQADAQSVFVKRTLAPELY